MTRGPEAIPPASITAANCAQALFTGWIARFGVPSVITVSYTHLTLPTIYSV